jgi:hypothetical protein
MEKILKGLQILSKYGNGMFSAEHDQIWTGSNDSVEKITPEDKLALEDLNWFLDEYAWSHFA